MQRWLFCLLGIYLFIGLAQADLYKHVDADGNITYTDVAPTEDAEAIKLPPVNVMEATKPAPTVKAKPDTQKPVDYENLNIVQPTPDQTLHDNTGSVAVQVAISPALTPGHSLRVMLNGKIVQQGNTNQAQLTGLDRGTHTLSVAVVDQNHKTLIEASSVTFHLKKHSVINNPLPKPPPTPPKATP